MSSLAAALALALAAADPSGSGRPGAIGEAPIAPAGSQVSALHGDEALSAWHGAVATGVAGKFGGMRLSSAHGNPSVLIFVGAQADAAWTEGFGQAARIRARLFAGGESEIYVPSDGDAEAAYAIGPREVQLVVGRVELARHPALGIEVLAQAATLPSFEGSLSLGSDRMRLSYALAPIEAAWVYYYGGAHLPNRPGWQKESDRPSAASAARLRHTVFLPPSLLVSVQGDLTKLWGHPDLLAGLEGSLGYQVLRRAATFSVAVRWDHFTRRGLVRDTSQGESEVLVLGAVTLAY